MKAAPPSNYFLIINPHAGGKKNKVGYKKVIRILQQRKLNFEHAFTAYPGNATKLTKEAINRGFDIVVALGGDGTVNEVAKGITGTSAKLGIIPLGSGNGLARELGIPMNTIKASLTLLSNNERLIDAWEINNQLFLCTAGIGFDAHIANKISKTNNRGAWKYIQLITKECIFYKPISVRLTIDKKPINTKVFLATFANISQFGNNAYISPKARVDDGKIDVILIKPFFRILLPLVGFAIMTRLILFLPFVKRYLAEEVLVLNQESHAFHFDGETCHATCPVKIRKLNDSLKIIC